MIVSGAAAVPRVDVETVLLCDVLADGTVAGVALVEPIYDTISGDRVGTRTVDPATGAAYTPTGTLQACQPDGCNATTTVLVLCDTDAGGEATQFVRATTYDCEGALLATLDRTLDGAAYTPVGTVGVCPTSPDCESPTTPVTSVGLCLADGTPIAVTVVRDCTGAVTSQGWINLTSGAWSAGTVPAGTVACGESRSIQVSGTFCDVDAGGEVVGLVLVEYTYDDTGAIASVRLVDAVTGGTYTPTGTITVCPAGVEQPERDLVQLCDVAADGTVTGFIRDYARDENGAVVGHSDYTLDGAAYTPAGTVGICNAGEECRNSSTVLVCDVPGDSTTAITPTIVDGVTADTGQTQFQNHPGPYTALWAGGTFLYPAGAGPAQEHLTATGQLTADLAECDGASGTVTISVRVRNDGPDTGQAWDGALRLFRGTTLIAAHNALEWAPVGWQGTLTVSAPVTAADIAAGDIRVALTLETYHLGAKTWTADQFTASLELEGCEVTSSTQFLRTLITDCATGETVSTVDTTLDGAPYTVTGEVGQCAPAETTSECRECDGLVLCDVAEDGTSTSFLRTVCRDCTGAVISTLDTDLDGATPYAIAGTVGRCCDTTVVAECTYSLPDSSTGFSFTNPAYPDCWVASAGAPTYTFGDRVTSFEAVYQTDTASGSVVRFSSPDLGGLISFAAFAPALAVQPANSSPTYVGTQVINGVTVTLTATAGDGLSRWSAFQTGMAVTPGDGFRIEFSEPVELQLVTSAFGDPVTINERLCGVAVDTVPWPAVRLADCNGTVSAVDPDTRESIPATATLDCEALDCDTAAVQVIRLCDLNPDGAPGDDGLICATPFLRHFVYDCAGTATFHDTELDGVTAYTPVEAVDCGESAPSLREQVWNTVSVAQDPTNPLVFTYTVANSENSSQTGTVRMTASKAYGGGCGGTPTAPVWNGPVTFLFEPDSDVLALADVLRVDAIDWDDWEDKTLSPAPSRVESDLGHVLNPGNRWHTLASNNLGHFYFDGPPTSVTMGNRNDGGGLACLAPAFGFITLVPGPACGGVPELDHIVQPLCDNSAAGTVTSFLRHWSVDNATGLLTALADTTLDGLTAYTPTGTVRVCGEPADAPVLTGVRRVTGSTTVQALKTEFPGLQSVSLSVLAGAVNVAGSSGTSQPLPAGASMTWSVADTDDSSLAAASFAGVSAAADYYLVWTYKGTAAG
ncbi:hypothetical protein [Streptomyces sp. 049-1]|uniref:hypothetical protein n=1 Tax=Streptomyces sp. 049-1 TaxID=2789264 RepID=UPI00397EF039